MADDNGNPFDTPLGSEVNDHQQAQATTVQASDNGNPFEEPLMSEKAESQPTTQPTADQVAYRKATAAGPFAPAGGAEKAMGQAIGDNKAQAKEGLWNLAKAAGYTATAAVPGVGEVAPEAGELVNAAGETIGEGAKSVMSHLTSTYGTPVVEAVKDAAATHPIVAKLLLYALETAGGLKMAQYMNLFSGRK